MVKDYLIIGAALVYILWQKSIGSLAKALE